MITSLRAHRHTESDSSRVLCCPQGSRSQTQRPPLSHFCSWHLFFSPPLSTVPPIQLSIHYSKISLSPHCLCTDSVTKSFFLFFSLCTCGHNTQYFIVSFCVPVSPFLLASCLLNFELQKSIFFTFDLQTIKEQNSHTKPRMRQWYQLHGSSIVTHRQQKLRPQSLRPSICLMKLYLLTVVQKKL